MQPNWSEIIKLPEAIALWIAIHKDDADPFIKYLEQTSDAESLFTEKPPEENPLPLSFGRTIRQFESGGELIGIQDELNILPINDLEEDAIEGLPEGFVTNDTGKPFYDLFHESDPIFVTVSGKRKLLSHAEYFEGSLMFTVTDPRYVDLKA